MIFRAISAIVGATNAARMASSSYRMHPSAHTSDAYE